MAILKSEVTAPRLSHELVNVPELGGELIISRLPLRDTLDLKLAEGEDSTLWACALLAKCVHTQDTQPALEASEWEIFFLEHRERFMALFAVAARLCGFDADAAQKK